ncbi:MAG: sigma-70 family RNA polymerase sigma factor [Deltaproteobacteria bacterium]|nr:sigma-70 family RNA polymerase sigma factor [Deltaproteobacteria bacterium]
MNGSLADVAADDASLLASSRAGDVAAFGQLIERYHNLVCAIAYSRTGDRIASEDIAQDTFLAAWRGIADLRDPDKLRGWLCGIARNLAGKTLRTRRRDAIEDVDDLEGQLAGDPGPLTAMLSKELESTVWAALEKLPATYREPLVLFYREQQSIKQVALGLGLTEETAKQRLSRGRLSLRENIGDLVEQTLQAGRPRKAAAAAVLAAILAAQGSSTAMAATHATRTAGRGYVLAAVGGVVAIAVGVAVFVGSTKPAERARSSNRDDGAAVEELRRAHDAYRASAPGVRTCELRGSVMRADRSAIAGALVTLVEHSWQAVALEPITVETDAVGQWKTPPITAGSYTVSVSAPGARAAARVATCAESRLDDDAFTLEATGATLRGSISDIGGGPIVGAMVWVLDLQQTSAMFVTRTDADGAYEIIVPPGLYMALLSHPEYAVEVRPVTLGDAGIREDFTLLPGASIEGTVVDSGGAPVAGAKVTTVAPSLQAQDGPVRWQLASTYGALLPVFTDANGRFRLRGLPPGTTRLTARASSLATTTPTTVELSLAQQATGATITVSTARTISGFVVARGAETRGVQSVQLVAFREDAPMALPTMATTDGAGYFELAGLTPGAYRIAATGAGHAPYVTEDHIAIADRDATDTVVVLERGFTVRGRVEPSNAASIKLVPAATAMSTVNFVKSAMTRPVVDDQGNFTFVAAQGAYIISATTFDRRAEQPLTVTSNQAGLRLTLQPRPAITGTVVDDTGAKLAGVLVAATPPRLHDPLGMLHTTVRTDDNGAFTIIGVTAGRHKLRVFDAKGQRPWAGTPKRPYKAHLVEVPATGAITEKLEVASRSGRISGVVVAADGRPSMDTWIEVSADDAASNPALFPSPPVLTDAHGRFSIDGVFGRELVVEASSSDGTQRAVTKAALGAQVKLELRPMATLAGKVTRDGKPVAAFEVRLRHTATEERHQTRGAAGAFSMPAMAGEYELSVTSALGYARRSITIGADPAIDLVLEPWSSLRGRVVGTDGKPWVGAMLVVDEYVDPTPLRTDASGAFKLERVIAGRNELMIVHATERGQFFTVDVELERGTQLDLDVISPRRERPLTGDPLLDLQAMRSTMTPQTTASSSADLGMQMFVSVDPPTAAELAAVKTDPLIASRQGKDAKASLWIVAVDPNGPAASAGFRRGDRIVGVGMTKINDGESAVELMMSLTQPWRSKGRSVPWAVVRGGRELKIDVLVSN